MSKTKKTKMDRKLVRDVAGILERIDLIAMERRERARNKLPNPRER